MSERAQAEARRALIALLLGVGLGVLLGLLARRAPNEAESVSSHAT